MLIIAMVYLLIDCFRDLDYYSLPKLPKLNVILLLISLSLIFTFLTGTGGLTTQYNDFRVHNVKFFDLYLHKWPIKYGFNNNFQIYYFGWYLIPTFFSKLFNNFNEASIFIWTWIGFFLSFFWIYILVKRSVVKTILVWISGGIGVFISLNIIGIFRPINIVEWNTPISSIFDLSCWIPGQVIPATILCSLFIYIIDNKLSLNSILFGAISCTSWMVFPFFVLCIICLFILNISNRTKDLYKLKVIPVLFSILILSIFAVYYAGSNSINDTSFLFKEANVLHLMKIHFLQIFIESAFVFVITFFFVQSNIEKKAIYFILVLRILLSYYRFGVFNDLFVKSNIVCQIFIFIYMYRTFKINISPQKVYFIIVTFIFSIYSLNIISNRLKDNYFTNPKTYVHFPINEYDDLYSYFLKNGNRFEQSQYASRSGSFYSKYFAP
jgi:hypothetical protein